MKINSSNLMFLIAMILSIFMALSANNVLFMWTAMELNMIVFMPILTKTKKMKDYSMKYLIIQSTSSSLMLMSILINLIIEYPINESVMLMMSMLMKLGMMPFHLWLPSLMQSSSWNTCLLMMTLQKLIPIMITSQLISMNLLILPMIMSMTLAPISTMNQTSTKKIMAYSSISNTPVMLVTMINSKLYFSIFMTIYSLINISMLKVMSKENLNYLNQMINKPNQVKMIILMNVLSLSGLPPMLGFFPKWIAIQATMKFSSITAMSMILSSIISIYIYMNMMIPTLTKISTKKNTQESKLTYEWMTITNLIGIPLTTILMTN